MRPDPTTCDISPMPTIPGQLHPRLVLPRYLWITAALILGLMTSHLLVEGENMPTSVSLIPRPREFSAGPLLGLSKGVAVVVRSNSKEDDFAAEGLRNTVRERGIGTAPIVTASVTVRLLRLDSPEAKKALSDKNLLFTSAMEPEGYILTSHAHTVEVVAASPAGIFYGVQTLKQLIQGNGSLARLRTAEIRDWPVMRYRGVDDDLSRGPLPTLEFQKQQIRTLAAYKINIYSPYFEHTFSYASTPLAGLPGGAMTSQEAAELVRYAARYHVTVVPEQEAFGHLHHLLTLEQYSQVAETPLGMVLAPDQAGSLAIIRQWFEELAEVFPAPFVHIGADETFDLGAGQTAARVKQNGLGSVYVDFVKQIHDALQPLHKRVLFWGDMAMNEPALVKTLPKDMIAVAWHYSPEPDGFDKWLQPYKEAGMETWVAPGANNWSQIYPNNDMTLLNVQGFVRDGQKLGSTGMLMTAWNDDGEGLFLQDWYGVLFAAAAAWQDGQSDISEFQNDYGPVFHGDLSGRLNDAQRELIAAHQALIKAGVGDETDTLFWLDPWSPTGLETGQKLLPYAHDVRLHAERALTLLTELQSDNTIRERDVLAAMDLGARRFDLLGFKFQSAAAILDGYGRALAESGDKEKWPEVDRELWTITGSDGRCEDLLQAYNYIRDEYRIVWLKENRPYWLGNVLDRYDMAAQLWRKRSEMFADAQVRWTAEHKLPAPDALGIPTARMNH
jgi:hexosaminidase